MARPGLMKSSVSLVDQIYRSVLFTKFFTNGWGDLHDLNNLLKSRLEISNREKCIELLARQSEDHPVILEKESKVGGLRVCDGYLKSPAAVAYPDLVPPPIDRAAFQLVTPADATGAVPLCILLAGTGDHGFWRRKHWMARPLAETNGIASLILENPFYGVRKPRQQLRSSLRFVSDLFVMGACLILECQVLLDWCRRQGFGPLALAGVSMGGHMASLAAAVWPEPIPLIPCLSGATASCVFTQGVMSRAIPWNVLQAQYHETLQRIEAESHLGMVVGRSEDAGSLMRVLMDEFTHLSNFPRPVDPELVLVVRATKDAYVHPNSVADLCELWPGMEVRDIPHSGHVSSCLLRHSIFRDAVVAAFKKYTIKYSPSASSLCYNPAKLKHWFLPSLLWRSSR